MKRCLIMLLALLLILGIIPKNTVNASEIVSSNDLSGKTVSILGDSISTYEGVSNDTSVNSTLANGAVYYTNSRISLENTWWKRTIDTLNLRLLVNNSWSGSCVLKTRSKTQGAYVDRCIQLHNDQTGEEPDIILILIGTNDFSYFQDSLGTAEIDYRALISYKGNGNYVYATPKTTCEAYAITLHKITKRYPNAEVYAMTLLPRRAEDYPGDDKEDVGQPTAFNKELAKIMYRYHVNVIDMEKCGITSDIETFDSYMRDKRVHPNSAGMQKISEAVIQALTSEANNSKSHTEVIDSAILPNCTESGLTEGKHCSVCDDILIEQEEISATGHSFSDAWDLDCNVCGDEREITQTASIYRGKVISILGDSISTFDGYIPKADGFNLEHHARYPQENLLSDVQETWWMQVINTLDAKLGINDSWRGTEIYNYIDAEVNSSFDGTKACMASTTRIQNLGSNGTPDIILFYGGNNDISQRRTIGTFNPETAPTDVDLVSVKWDTVADAYTTAIMRLQHYYPDAQIISLLPGYTSDNKDSILDKYNLLFADICDHYGVTWYDLRNCGMTTSQLPDGTHPNTEGMDYITAAVLKILTQECVLTEGEHHVYPITHNLTNVTASRSYFTGVSAGKVFTETLSGHNIAATVTMNGLDITDLCYSDGEISISNVTGNIVITAKGSYDMQGHLQQLPEKYCCTTNIWELLEHDRYYFVGGTKWGISDPIHSVTIPVNPGDKLYATSFQKNKLNGNSTTAANGIRVTYFGNYDIVKTLSPTETYQEFVKDGYLTVPDNAVAVNIPMWNSSKENKLYLLNKEHTEEAILGNPATCTVSGLTDGTKCSVCGTVTVEQQIISATGHTWDDGIQTTAPTEDTTGIMTYTCTVCGTTKTDSIPVLEHTHAYVPTVVPPTCGDSGYTEYTCSCGDTYQDGETASLGHSYTDDKDAICDICGEEREIAIASVPMHRMYDPNSGEHFYTGSEVERDFLMEAGWHYEGVGFNFPEEGKPVYRLYEPVHGEHLYTMDKAEKEKLLSWGWNDEGVAFNSAGTDEVPQYRLHNPNANRGGYHFTGSTEERDFLISIGWIDQGIGWYSCLE